jgi:hypothetical protein
MVDSMELKKGFRSAVAKEMNWAERKDVKKDWILAGWMDCSKVGLWADKSVSISADKMVYSRAGLWADDWDRL